MLLYILLNLQEEAHHQRGQNGSLQSPSTTDHSQLWQARSGHIHVRSYEFFRENGRNGAIVW